MPSTYLFRDAQHKKDCLIQSMQLSRAEFSKNPPRTQRDQIDALQYLGIIYLIENSVSRLVLEDKKGEKLGLNPEELRSFQKLRAKLRKTANKFFEDPTKTTLRLSAI